MYEKTLSGTHDLLPQIEGILTNVKVKEGWMKHAMVQANGACFHTVENRDMVHPSVPPRLARVFG